MTATRPEVKPCRVKLTGGATRFVRAHHRDVQRAVRDAKRAGAETVTVAGIVLPVAAVVIVLPYRKRRRDPLAYPYPKGAT